MNALLALTAAGVGAVAVAAARLAYLVKDPNRRLVMFAGVGVVAAAGVVLCIAAIRSAP